MKRVPLLYKHNMLRDVIDNIHVSINIFDRDGRRIFVNPYYFHLAGKRKGIKIGSNFKSGKTYRRKDSYLDSKVKEAITTGKVFEIHNHFHKSKNPNTSRYLDIIIGPIRNNSGEITGAYSMAKDETSRFLARNRLINLNATLEKRVSNRTEKLEKLNKKLKKLSDEKNLLVSHVAHEIKTMLTIIKGNIELVMQENENSNYESESEINDAIDKLSKIVSDLVFITKTEAYSNLFNFEIVDISQVAIEAVKEHRIISKEKSFRISFSLRSPRPIKVSADKIKINTLVSNMIENAVKYGKDNGKLQIILFKEKKKVYLQFKDNGQGIDKENLDRIFDPFFQVNKTNHNSGTNRGFGLGLAICKKIVSAHKGEIDVESKLGKGTTFTVILPAK